MLFIQHCDHHYWHGGIRFKMISSPTTTARYCFHLRFARWRWRRCGDAAQIILCGYGVLAESISKYPICAIKPCVPRISPNWCGHDGTFHSEPHFSLCIDRAPFASNSLYQTLPKPMRFLEDELSDCFSGATHPVYRLEVFQSSE